MKILDIDNKPLHFVDPTLLTRVGGFFQPTLDPPIKSLWIPPEHSKRTILLIEDQVLLLKILLRHVFHALLLDHTQLHVSLPSDNQTWQELQFLCYQTKNITIICASNGNVAYDFVKKSMHSPVSLIITDNDMPQMTGMDLIPWLRALDKEQGMNTPIALNTTARKSDIATFLSDYQVQHIEKNNPSAVALFIMSQRALFSMHCDEAFSSTTSNCI